MRNYLKEIMRNMLGVLLMLSLLIAAEPHICSAELIDRVVAYVDDHAITYSRVSTEVRENEGGRTKHNRRRGHQFDDQ